MVDFVYSSMAVWGVLGFRRSGARNVCCLAVKLRVSVSATFEFEAEGLALIL